MTIALGMAEPLRPHCGSAGGGWGGGSFWQGSATWVQVRVAEEDQPLPSWVPEHSLTLRFATLLATSSRHHWPSSACTYH